MPRSVACVRGATAPALTAALIGRTQHLCKFSQTADGSVRIGRDMGGVSHSVYGDASPRRLPPPALPTAPALPAFCPYLPALTAYSPTSPQPHHPTYLPHPMGRRGDVLLSTRARYFTDGIGRLGVDKRRTSILLPTVKIKPTCPLSKLRFRLHMAFSFPNSLHFIRLVKRASLLRILCMKNDKALVNMWNANMWLKTHIL